MKKKQKIDKKKIQNPALRDCVKIADSISGKIKGKHPGGRPTIYTVELGNKICDAVKNSVRGLRFICEDNKDFPSVHTVRDWLFNNKFPEFTRHYDDAKRFQSDLMADEIIEVSYNAHEHSQSGRVDKAKLQVESLKWVASHLKPKKWSDKFNEEDEKENRNQMTENEIADKLNIVLEKAIQRKYEKK
jgi:hypothetical protein